MEKALDYASKKSDEFLTDLFGYLRIQSVSALPEHRPDMQNCADYAIKMLNKAGIKKTEKIQTSGNPLVYAEWINKPGSPTILIYGHYDVQPVDPLEEWKTSPFEPVVKDGYIYGRGSDDDKGQHFTHIKALESYLKSAGELPLNVKVLLEGEEEIGSGSIGEFLKTNKEKLKCDAVLISDTDLYDVNVPTINYGLRGLAFMEIEVVAGPKDLHSGTFGGAVPNPANILARIIASLHDEKLRVTIPGFYDKVRPLTQQEIENIKFLNHDEEKYRQELGIEGLEGEEGYSVLERTWARPTLDCNGIVGGFIGEGAKTIIPAKASAKISMRLVPDQTPEEIADLFKAYIEKIAPKTVKVNVRYLHGGAPIMMSLEDKAIRAGSKAVEESFGGKCVYTREGGSIPIVVDFVKELEVPAVLMGLGVVGDAIHSPNERFAVASFLKGVKSSILFMKNYAEMF